MLNDGKPGDRRNFVHRKIIGAIGGAAGALISGGNPITGAIGGFAKGGTSAPAPVRSNGLITTLGQLGGAFVPTTGGCSPGFFRAPDGSCQQLLGRPTPGALGMVQRTLPFGATGLQQFGEAVMGQFGAALEPGIRPSDVRVCPRGTVLGVDDLCYNKRDIKNSERKWPRGRRPLLTGGDMRCISIASAAAKRLQSKQKQLQTLGLLKKPSRRAAPRALPGHHQHTEHN